MALQHRITVNGSSYDIDPDVDIRALMDQIESAIQAGGRFVRIALVRGHVLDALITSGLAVNIESATALGLEVVPTVDDAPISVFDEFDEFDGL